jgi:hypothetical protein
MQSINNSNSDKPTSLTTEVDVSSDENINRSSTNAPLAGLTKNDKEAIFQLSNLMSIRVIILTSHYMEKLLLLTSRDK